MAEYEDDGNLSRNLAAAGRELRKMRSRLEAQEEVVISAKRRRASSEGRTPKLGPYPIVPAPDTYATRDARALTYREPATTSQPQTRVAVRFWDWPLLPFETVILAAVLLTPIFFVSPVLGFVVGGLLVPVLQIGSYLVRRAGGVAPRDGQPR